MGNASSQTNHRVLTHEQKKLFITGFTRKFCNKTYPYDVIILLSKWIDDTITITFNKKSLNDLMSNKDNKTTDELIYTITYSNIISIEISILLTENECFVGLEFKFIKLLSTISWLSCYTDIKCIETGSNEKLTKKVKFNKYNDDVSDINKYYNIIPMSKYQSDHKQLTFEIYIEFIRVCFNDNSIQCLIPSAVMYRDIFYKWIINVNDKNKLKDDDELRLSENFCNDCMACYFEPYTNKFGIRVFKLPLNVKYITANITFELKNNINGNCIDLFNYKSKIIMFGCHLHWQYFDIEKYLEFIKDKLVFDVCVKIEKVFVDDNRQINEADWKKYGIIGNGIGTSDGDLDKGKSEKDNELGITLMGLEIDEEWKENEGMIDVKHETLMGCVDDNDGEVENVLSGKAITLMGET